MKQYLDLMQDILKNGHKKEDRTGTGTLSVFGRQMRFDLKEGFPLVTTKKVHLRSIIHELLWFLRGDTNTRYLKENNVTIWDEWSKTVNRTVAHTYTLEERAAILRKRSSIDGKVPDWYTEWEAGLLSNVNKDASMAVLDGQNVPREGFREEVVEGELGPVYGKQWRDWADTKLVGLWDEESKQVLADRGYKVVGNIIRDNPEENVVVVMKSHDQISTVMKQLQNDPDSRRIIVSAWNVGDLADMALAPCHSFFQFYTRELSMDERRQWVKDNDWESWESLEETLTEQLAMQDIDHDEAEEARVEMVDEYAPKRELSCQLYQRSMDVFLGCPFNIASYALLTHMIAHQLHMSVGELVHTSGDTHLYLNHLEQAKLQLTRDPLPLPKLNFLRRPDSIFDYEFEDFEIEGYQSHEAIKAPVAV